MNTSVTSATHPRTFAIATTLCLLGFGLHAASPVDQQKLASANIDFAFKLLKQLAKDQPGTNIFISPYSASTVLQMACNGAKGQTKTEMQRVLGTTGLADEGLVFHLRAGREKQAPMMEQTRKFTYRQGTGYQAVRLPYHGGDLAMYVFLPDPGSSPEKLIGIMTGDTWQRVTKPGFSERHGTLVLPRFKVEYGVELKQPLKALGMRLAFSGADLSGISDRLPFLSAVRQRAFVEVNEEGTDAAAVTMMNCAESIEMNPPKPFQMIVDRPFLFLIEDQQTRTILFMGMVFDPSASS